MDHRTLEEGTVLNLDFQKLKKVANCGEDIIPAVAQDANTGEVLIVGYANDLALNTAQKEKMATFWSTSLKMNFGLKAKLPETTWRLLRFALTVSRTPFYIV